MSYAAQTALARILDREPPSVQAYFRRIADMTAEAARHGRHFVNPSIDAMAALTSYSRRAMQRAKKRLAQLGLLTISQAYRFAAGFAIRCRDRLTLTVAAGGSLRPGANALGLRDRHDEPPPRKRASRLYRYLMQRTAPLRSAGQLTLPIAAPALPIAAPMGDSDGTARQVQTTKEGGDLASRSAASLAGFEQRRLQRRQQLE